MKKITDKSQYKRYLLLKSFARNLRNKQTEHEQIIWEYIRRKKIYNIQFFRQRIILNKYIVDFYAPRIKLVLEIDGIQHNKHFYPENAVLDKIRDQELLDTFGIKVQRYTNLSIETNITSVLNHLKLKIKNLIK